MYHNGNYLDYEENGVSVLEGRTLTEIKHTEDDELIFYVEDGSQYIMAHSQDCCESVTIDDICGDLKDLVGDCPGRFQPCRSWS